MSKARRKQRTEPDITTMDSTVHAPNQEMELPVTPVQALNNEPMVTGEPITIEPEVINPHGTLIAHCGTSKITRAELQLLPTPQATKTHQPLPHYLIIEQLIEALSFRHIMVVRDEYAISPDSMRMFGLLELNAEFNGCRFAIGIRNSNDKSMRLAMTVGLRVTVCDNMCFKGDFHPVLAKHSRNFNLIDSISIGVDKIQRNFEPLKEQVHKWQQEYLKNDEARLIIYSAFMESKLKIPHHLMSDVHKFYFTPSYEEFRDPTLWSLSNAFTSAFKAVPPIRQFQLTAKLGDFMERYATPY